MVQIVCSKHKVKIEQTVQLKGKVKEDALSCTKEVRFIKSSFLHKRGKIYQKLFPTQKR